MSYPTIRTITKEGIDGIIQLGNPRGLWIAKEEEKPVRWIGVDSMPGHLTIMKRGPFPQVLTWLMVRAGIISPQQVVEMRNASRDPEYQRSQNGGPEMRINAEIQVLDKAKPKKQAEGITDKRREALRRRWDEYHTVNADREEWITKEILRGLTDGETYKEIGQRVGLSDAVVYHRIKMMKARGIKIPPLRKDREKERVAERDAMLLELFKGGKTAMEASWELGCSYNLAYKKMKAFMRQGKL